MMSMSQRIAAAAACALLLAYPASAQLIGSGHVMGNGTASPAAPTDTSLLGVLSQSGSGLTRAGNTAKLATVTGTIASGHCRSTDASGNDIDAGGACTVGGGGGTVTAATIPTTASGLKPPLAVYSGTPGASSTTVVGLAVVPPGNGGAQCTPFETFGGGTGVAAGTNVTAYGNLVAAYPSQGGCAGFGAGNYSFNGQLTVGYPTQEFYSAAVRGVGPDATILTFSNANGLAFAMGATTQPSFHVSDLTLATQNVNSGTAITATYLAAQKPGISLSDIDRVEIRPDSMAANTNYWSTGIRLNGVSGVNMDSVNITGALVFGGAGGAANGGLGIGVSLSGDTAINSFGVLINMSNSNLQFLNNAFLINANIQGVSISNTNVNFNSLGIGVPSGITPGALGVAGLLIANSYMSNYGTDVFIGSPFDSLQMTGNNILVFPNTTGIQCDSCSDSIFAGNTINSEAPGNPGNIGLTILNNSAGNSGSILVTGNSFGGLTDGVIISSGVTGTTLQSNRYNGNTVNVANSGTISAGSCAGIGGTCTAGATP